jgi:serine phosphatase RsbU (regulator of sigma subunit)
MTASTPGPTGAPPHELPAGRLQPFAHVLRHTVGGRLFALGLVVKVICWLVRLAVGSEPAVVAFADAIGSLALIGAAGCLVVRLVPRARRRRLWRVRDQLILSYVFIGVIPALLIVSFFIVSGLVLFLNVAAFLVTNGFNTVRDEAVYLSRVAALEIQRGPGPDRAAAILAQREAALTATYPGASMALVPTGGPEPCVGGPSAGPRQLPTVVAAERDAIARPAEVTPSQGKAGALPAGKAQNAAAAAAPAHAPIAPSKQVIAPMAVGPWEHAEAPTTLPAWVSCAGFGGIVVEPLPVSAGAGGDAKEAPAVAVVRGVGLPDAARPAFAVVVDIPKNDGLDNHLRDETSVKLGSVSIVLTEGLRARLMRPKRAVEGLVNRDPAASGRSRVKWVAFLQGTEWDSGQPVQTMANIQVNIAEIYDRLSSVDVGARTLGGWVLYFMLFVAILFLLIEAAALVMGLALARSITGSVHELFEGTERVRAGDFSHRIEVMTRDQLGDLGESFNQMTASIEDLLRQAEEKKRLEEELRIARAIQMSLLPRGQIAVPGLSISALCVPAREVGGDYYDFFPLGDDRLGVLIADVSGKGTSAALYMAELKGLMLSLSRTCPSPRQLMLTANEIISENLDSRSFITMTYAVVDLAARTMTYARAGHTPLIYRRERDGDPCVEVFTPDGLVLGLRIDGGELFDRLLTEVTLPLDRGDLLLLFTDGISEAMNADSDLFGEARLARLVEEHGHLPADELRERILREIEAFVAGAPQHDDMTMILMKFDDFLPGAVRAGFKDGRA